MPNTNDEKAEAERKKRRDELAALLFTLLTFGADDIAKAVAFWSEHVTPAYAGLLDGSGKYRFDPDKQVFVRADTDRVIPPSELKRVAVTFGNGVGRDVLEPDAARMFEGGAAVEQWSEKFAMDVKQLALGQAALGVGGFANLNADAIARLIGDEERAPGLKFTFSKLAGFAVDVELKADRASTIGAVTNRAGMYAKAQQSVLEDQRRQSHIGIRDASGRLKYLFERNELGPAEQHCSSTKFSTGCIEATDAGWQPIGTLPLPGLRTCIGACLCSLHFSLTGPASEEN